MSTNIQLLQGEVFDSNAKSDNVIIARPDDEINNKYRRGEIRIITEQARYPLDSIQTMLESKQGAHQKYILNPEYQRRKRWDNVRKSRLIESFIMNVPIPPIFLYEIDYSIYEVMDGLQRLTAIYDFYVGKFALEGLEYWQELNGKTYEKLPGDVKRGIDRRYLSSIVLLQETAKSNEQATFLKQVVFGRLNTGGEKLTPQETRNALLNGKFNQLCIRLAQNDIFRKMWQMPPESEVEDLLVKNEEYLLENTNYSPIAIEAYRKMTDVELVLRFFAYRHINKLKSRTVEKFLDEYLNAANQFSDTTIQALEKLFLDTITLVYDILGETAFLLPPTRENRKGYQSSTKTIYDAIMQAFTMNLENKEQLQNHKQQIKDNLYKNKHLLSISGNKSLFDGRYNNKVDVIARIDYFNNFLQSYIV
jgi:Protein of unknown function DUF262/Phage integrase, N-terminal SAM-like domain